MPQQPFSESAPKISIELIAENIRAIRNENIQYLLTAEGLSAFMEHYFNARAISSIKAEFLRRDLQQLSKDTIDLAFYSSLITLLKSSGQVRPPDNHPLFLADLMRIFSKYGFTRSGLL